MVSIWNSSCKKSSSNGTSSCKAKWRMRLWIQDPQGACVTYQLKKVRTSQAAGFCLPSVLFFTPCWNICSHGVSYAFLLEARLYEEPLPWWLDLYLQESLTLGSHNILLLLLGIRQENRWDISSSLRENNTFFHVDLMNKFWDYYSKFLLFFYNLLLFQAKKIYKIK